MSKTSNMPSVKQTKNQPGEKTPQKKGKRAEEIMKDHIQDEDHIISDEDFKNLNTEAEASVDHETLDIPEDSNRPKDEEKDHNTKTPWDVIS